MPDSRPERSACTVSWFDPGANVPLAGETLSHPLPCPTDVVVAKVPATLEGLNRLTGPVTVPTPAVPPSVSPPVENRIPAPFVPDFRTVRSTETLWGEFTAP